MSAFAGPPGSFGRRVSETRRRLTIPLTLGDQLEDQPVQPSPTPAPPPDPSEFLNDILGRVRNLVQEDGRLAAMEEDARRSGVIQEGVAGLLARQAQQRAQEDEERKKRLEALVESFSPNEPSQEYLQAVAMRPQFDPSQLHQQARRAQGIENARQFRETMEHLAPHERIGVASLAPFLSKEGLKPKEYVEIIEAARNDPTGQLAFFTRDKFDPDKLKAANRVFQNAHQSYLTQTSALPNVSAPAPYQINPVPDDGLSSFEAAIKLLDEDEEKFEETITGFPGSSSLRQRIRGVKEDTDARNRGFGLGDLVNKVPFAEQAIETADRFSPDVFNLASKFPGVDKIPGASRTLDTLSDVSNPVAAVRQGVDRLTPEVRPRVFQEAHQALENGDELGALTLVLGSAKAPQVLNDLDPIFRAEQEVFGPPGRVLWKKVYEELGFPESWQDTMAKYTAEFAVPSSLIGIGIPGKAGKITRALSITKRGAVEGLINLKQDQAGRAERGEPPPTPEESTIIFLAGGTLAGLAPEAASPVLRKLGRVMETLSARARRKAAARAGILARGARTGVPRTEGGVPFRVEDLTRETRAPEEVVPEEAAPAPEVLETAPAVREKQVNRASAAAMEGRAGSKSIKNATDEEIIQARNRIQDLLGVEREGEALTKKQRAQLDRADEVLTLELEKRGVVIEPEPGGPAINKAIQGFDEAELRRTGGPGIAEALAEAPEQVGTAARAAEVPEVPRTPEVVEAPATPAAPTRATARAVPGGEKPHGVKSKAHRHPGGLKHTHARGPHSKVAPDAAGEAAPTTARRTPVRRPKGLAPEEAAPTRTAAEPAEAPPSPEAGRAAAEAKIADLERQLQTPRISDEFRAAVEAQIQALRRGLTKSAPSEGLPTGEPPTRAPVEATPARGRRTITEADDLPERHPDTGEIIQAHDVINHIRSRENQGIKAARRIYRRLRSAGLSKAEIMGTPSDQWDSLIARKAGRAAPATGTAPARQPVTQTGEAEELARAQPKKPAEPRPVRENLTPETATRTYTREELEKLKRPSLQTIARKLGVSDKGKKAEITNRIMKAQGQQQQRPPEVRGSSGEAEEALNRARAEAETPFTQGLSPEEQATEFAERLRGAENPGPLPNAKSGTHAVNDANRSRLQLLDGTGHAADEAGPPPRLTPERVKELTPRGRDDFIAKVAIWYRELLHKSDSIASAVKARMDATEHALIGKPGSRAAVHFDDAGNVVRGVTPNKDGVSLNWQDVFENPDDYTWDPAFRAYRDQYMQIIQIKIDELAERIPAFRAFHSSNPDRKPWVRRVVVRLDGKDLHVGPRGGVGAKQGFTMARTRPIAGSVVGRFEDELANLSEEGRAEVLAKFASETVEYNKSPSQSLQTFFLEADRTIADAEFADRMKPLTRTRLDKIPEGYKIEMRRLIARRASIKRAIDKARGRKVGLGEAKRRVVGPKEAKERSVTRFEEGREAQATRLNDLEQELTAIRGKIKELRKEGKVALQAAGPRSGETTLKIRGRPAPFAGGRIISEEAQRAVARQFSPVLGVRIGEGEFKAVPESVSKHFFNVLEAVGAFNDVFRPIWAVGDLSYIGLQTLPGWGVNPKAVTSAWTATVRAIRDPQVYYDWVRTNEKWIDEAIQDGMPFYGTHVSLDATRMQDYSGWIQQFRRLSGMKIANDSWNRGVNMVSVELYKQHRLLLEEIGEAQLTRLYAQFFGGAFEPGVPARQQLARVVSHGTGRFSLAEMAQSGPGGQLFLRTVPFAGRYWTAYLRLIGEAISKGGLGGNTARRLVAGWAISGVTMMTLLSTAFSAPEIKKKLGQGDVRGAADVIAGNIAEGALDLNPAELREGKIVPNPNWMTVKLPSGGRIGPGGPIQQIGKIITTLSTRGAYEPEDIPEIITRTFRGKLSPAGSVMYDLITGQTFIGERTGISLQGEWETAAGLSYLVSKIVPFAAQEPVRELARGDVEEFKQELAEGSPASFFGLRAFPESKYRDWKDAQNEGLNQLSPTAKEQFYANPANEGVPWTYDEVKQRDPEIASRVDRLPQVEAAREEMQLHFEDFPQSNVDEFFNQIDTAREESRADQEQDDANVVRFWNSGGRDIQSSMNPRTWRNRQWERRGEMILRSDVLQEALNIQFESDVDEDTMASVIEEYFNLLSNDEEFVDPVTGVFDRAAREAAIDEVLSPLSEEDQKRFIDYTRRNLTPLQKEFERDRDTIEASGYWDLADQAWQLTKERMAPLAQQEGIILPDHPGEFIGPALDRWFNIAKGMGYSDTEAEKIAHMNVRTGPYLSTYYAILGDDEFGVRSEWRGQTFVDPNTGREVGADEIQRLLQKWGYNPYTLEDSLFERFRFGTFESEPLFPRPTRAQPFPTPPPIGPRAPNFGGRTPVPIP